MNKDRAYYQYAPRAARGSDVVERTRVTTTPQALVNTPQRLSQTPYRERYHSAAITEPIIVDGVYVSSVNDVANIVANTTSDALDAMIRTIRRNVRLVSSAHTVLRSMSQEGVEYIRLLVTIVAEEL